MRTHGTADHWIEDTRVMRNRVFIWYRLRDGSIGEQMRTFPTVDQAKEYDELVRSLGGVR